MTAHIGLVQIDQPGKDSQRHDVSGDKRPDDTVSDPLAKSRVLQGDLIFDGQRFAIRDLVKIDHLGFGWTLPCPGKGGRVGPLNRQGKSSRAVCRHPT